MVVFTPSVFILNSPKAAFWHLGLFLEFFMFPFARAYIIKIGMRKMDSPEYRKEISSFRQYLFLFSVI